MKKSLLLLLLLTARFTSTFCQIWTPFYENFSNGNNGWLDNGIAVTTAGALNACGSFHAIGYVNNLTPNVSAISPLVGTTAGGVVSVSYNYKLTTYISNNFGGYLTSMTNPWGTLNVQYSSSQAGPWTTIHTINSTNHTVSSNCSTVAFSFTPPAAALYLRFEALHTNGDWRIHLDDITVSEAVPPCTGVPNPGTTTTSNGTSFVCSQNTAGTTLGVSNPILNSGYTYQWYKNNLPVAGASSSTFFINTFSTIGDTFYVAQSCGASTTTTTPIVLSSSAQAPYCGYCMPTYTNGCVSGHVIAKVKLDSLTNLSGTDCTSDPMPGAQTAGTNGNGFTDYTASTYTTSLTQNNTYTLTVHAGMGNVEVAAWIDWDGNGIFDYDNEERLGYSPYAVLGSNTANVLGDSLNLTFQVPCNAPLGLTRMRVMCRAQSSVTSGFFINPCQIFAGSVAEGEIEDYIVNITQGVLCYTPFNASTFANTGDSITLQWTKGCAENNWDIYITQTDSLMPSNTPTYTAITNQNSANNNIVQYTLSNLSGGKKYTFWVRSNCLNNTTNSAWAGPYTFTTIPTCYPPTNITATSITDSTAVVTYSYDTGVAPINYRYILSTSATTPNNNQAGVQIIASTINTLIFDSLMPFTTYYIWLQGLCGGADTSFWNTVYSFTTLPTGCTPSLAVGSIVANDSVCANTNNIITADSSLLAYNNLSYAWQVADDSAFTQNISNLDTNFAQTISINSIKYYKVLVTCNSGGAVYTSPIKKIIIKQHYNCYCSSYAESQSQNIITNMVVSSPFDSITQASPCGTLAPGIGSVANDYSNYMAGPILNIRKLDSIKFAISINSCNNSSWGDNTLIYIDYNHNGIFEEGIEKVGDDGPAPEYDNRIYYESNKIPATAQLGLTGMRIVNAVALTADALDACHISTFGGETEDYLINILDSNVCAGIPPIGSIISSNYNSCQGDTIVYTLLNPYLNASYQWYKGSVPLPMATSTTYSTNAINNSDSIYCQLTCGASIINSNKLYQVITPKPTDSIYLIKDTVCPYEAFYIFNSDTNCYTINNLPAYNYTYVEPSTSISGANYSTANSDTFYYEASPTPNTFYQVSIIPNYANGFISFDYYFTDTAQVSNGSFSIMDNNGRLLATDTTNALLGVKNGTLSFALNGGMTVKLNTASTANGGTTQLVINNITFNYCTTNNIIKYYSDSGLTNIIGISNLQGSTYINNTTNIGATTIYAVPQNVSTSCLGNVVPLKYFVKNSPTINNVTYTMLRPNTISPSTVCNNDSAILSVNYSNGHFAQWKHDNTIADSIYVATLNVNNYEVTVTDSINGCSTEYNFGSSLPTLSSATVSGTLFESITPLCQGDSIAISYSGMEPITVADNVPLNQAIPAINNQIFTATILDTLNGCIAKQTLTTQINRRLKIDSVTVNEVNPCTGQLITLKAHSYNNVKDMNAVVVNYLPLTVSTSPYYLINNKVVGYPMEIPNLDEGMFKAITLPFNFMFYGNEYDKIYLSTNGTLSFSAAEKSNQSYQNTTLPSQANKSAVINFAHTDLDFNTAPSYLRYFVEGITPSRKFILELDAPTYNKPNAAHVKGYLQLSEIDNKITITIDTLAKQALDGAFATIGIQDQNKVLGQCLPGAPCNDSNVSIYHTTWQIEPIYATSNFRWFKNNFNTPLLNDTLSTLQLAVDTTTTIFVALEDSLTCTSYDSIIIAPLPLPNVNINAVYNTNCINTAIQINAIGALNYNWSNGQIDSTIYTTSTAIMQTYTVQGIDANNCSQTNTVVVIPGNSNNNIALSTTGNVHSIVGADSLQQYHANGITLDYTSTTCELIATINDIIDSNALGITNVGVFVNTTLPTINSYPTSPRWYSIKPTNQGAALVTLYQTQADFDAYNLASANYTKLPTNMHDGVAINNIRITKVDSTGNSVVLIPQAIYFDSVKNYWVISFFINSYSNFYIHTLPLIPLNLELVALDAIKNKEGNFISWKSTNGNNYIKYTLQKSNDGNLFTEVYSTNNMDSLSQNYIYSYLDKQPYFGYNHYRLLGLNYQNIEQVISPTKSLYWNIDKQIRVFPNPAIDKLNIIMHVEKHTSISIVDVTGKKVQDIAINNLAISNNIINIDIGSLSKGCYYLKVINTNSQYLQKFIKL
jgi:hypothetical protein